MDRLRMEIFRLAKFAVVLVILMYVLNKAGGVQMLQLVREANPLWIAVSVLCFFLSIFLGAFQWHFLLGLQGIAYGMWNSFKTYYSAMFINAVVFNLAGDALRVYALKRKEADVVDGFAATFMDRFMGLFVLSLFSLMAVSWMQIQGDLVADTIGVLFTFSLGVFLVFAGGAAVLASRRFGNLFQWLLQLMGLKKMKNFYERIRRCMMLYREQWPQMILAGFLSAAVHSLRIGGHLCCAYALSLPIAPITFFCFIPIISLATLIPLNVGGWGVPQGISTFLYGLEGVIRFEDPERSTALAAGTLTFLPSIIFYGVMLMGGFFLLSLFRKKQSPHD